MQTGGMATEKPPLESSLRNALKSALKSSLEHQNSSHLLGNVLLLLLVRFFVQCVFLVNKRLLFIPPPCQLIVTLANGHASPRVMNYDILSSRKTNLAPCQLTVCRWVDSWVAISKFRDYWQQNSCSKKVPSSKDDLLCSAGSLRLLSRLVLGQRKKKNATTASGCEFGIKILRFFPKKGGLWNKRSSLVPALKGFCVPPFAQPGVPV